LRHLAFQKFFGLTNTANRSRFSLALEELIVNTVMLLKFRFAAVAAVVILSSRSPAETTGALGKVLPALFLPYGGWITKKLSINLKKPFAR